MNNLPSSPALLVVRGGACSLARPFPGFPPLLSLPPPLNVHLMHGRLGRQNGPGLTRNFARVVAAADSSPAELARAALWSETQKWGPRGARGKTPAQWRRPARRRGQRAARGASNGGRAVTDCGAAGGALAGKRSVLPLAPRGAPLMTLLVLSSPLGRSAATGRADTSERAGWIAGWREAAAATSKRSKLL